MSGLIVVPGPLPLVHIQESGMGVRICEGGTRQEGYVIDRFVTRQALLLEGSPYS